MARHRIREGLDLPLAGAPVQSIDAGAPGVGSVRSAGSVRRVGLLGADLPGLRPQFAVQPGDRVLRGQTLFVDRRQPAIAITAPAAGTVQAIHRGAQRVFVSLVIEVADDDGPAAQVPLSVPAVPAGDIAQADPAALRALLLASGLWTALRTRPFSRLPAPDAVPAALFVTALDTAPHAPDPQVVLAAREDDLRAGLAALARMVQAPVHLCVAPGSRLAAAAPAGVAVHEFDGPHPAGTPGVHIHALQPVGAGVSVWHIGVQDVAAIGRLFTRGELDVERVVALAGPAVRRPRLVRTRLGAALDELMRGELVDDAPVRIVSGSVLDGRTAGDDTTAFLGRHHRQVSALHEGGERELFGWITPQPRRFSLWSVVAGHFAGRFGRPLPLDTSVNGGDRAMVPIGSFERVLPMDLMATHLLRALAVGDAEQAVALGALELDEEDLALATFVDPGKTEWGPLLRRVLDRVEKEGV
jgi:Na+-transporting NADH:ubiquinone oxidoreductase subunit A